MRLQTDDDYIDSLSQEFKFKLFTRIILLFKIFIRPAPCSRKSLLDVLTELLLLPGGEDPVDHDHDQADEDEGQPNSQQSTPVGLDQTHVE